MVNVIISNSNKTIASFLTMLKAAMKLLMVRRCFPAVAATTSSDLSNFSPRRTLLVSKSSSESTYKFKPFFTYYAKTTTDNVPTEFTLTHA